MTAFHLIVSTLGRPGALERLIDSLQRQGASYFLTVVEQSTDPSCHALVEPLIAAGNAEYLHERNERGLSRGRNRGLAQVRGDIVAFPDDDCWYPDGLLSDVQAAFTSPTIEGISTLLVDERGESALLRWATAPQRITPSAIPRTVSSVTLFFRAELAARIGPFDPHLGSGSGTPFAAGEETDYTLRALRLGADIQYIPELRVMHAEWRAAGTPEQVRAKVRGYNRGFGRVLRKHRRTGEFVYWASRSVVGALIRLVTFDRAGAAHQIDQLRGRVSGFFARPDASW